MTTISRRPRKRHRITPPPAIPTIPDDLLVSEILVRLPAAFLLRSRSVCRSWRAAVKDPAFIRRHVELSRVTPPAPVILAISLPPTADDDLGEENEEEATTATPTPARAVVTVRAAHCDGLVAVTASTGATARTTVWNPATMESVDVPTASPNAGAGLLAMVKSVVTAIGFDPSTNGYVLSRFFYRVTRVFRDELRPGTLVVEHDSVGHEVLRLGSGDRWRLTEDAPFPIDDTVPPVSCAHRGAIYWAAMDPSGGGGGGGEDDDCDGEDDDCDGGGANVLLRFSVRDETFAAFPLPPGAGCVGWRDRVVELAGELCLARAAGPTAFDVWVAAAGGSGGEPEWSLWWHVDFYRPVDFVAPLAVDGSGVLLMSVDDEDMYRYDKENKVLEKVADLQQVLRHVRWNWNGSRGEDDDVTPSCSAEQLLVPCVESLVSIAAFM
ncbi:unnamed protein product [Urochloa humidicola]